MSPLEWVGIGMFIFAGVGQYTNYKLVKSQQLQHEAILKKEWIDKVRVTIADLVGLFHLFDFHLPEEHRHPLIRDLNSKMMEAQTLLDLTDQTQNRIYNAVQEAREAIGNGTLPNNERRSIIIDRSEQVSVLIHQLQNG